MNVRAQAFQSETTILEVFAIWLGDVDYPGYTFRVERSSTGCMYLQATYEEADTVNGAVETQYTRRWLLSPEMTRSETIATAFKCVLTSMEHRCREWFTYKGKAIYQPHYDVDQLAAICQKRDVRL
jgi:hypothetical protein